MTFSLSHISSATIFIRSHQPIYLTTSSLSRISSIAITILCHITTSLPPMQSSFISDAADASNLLNYHPAHPPPTSFSRISTTIAVIFMSLHHPLHYTMTILNILSPFFSWSNYSSFPLYFNYNIGRSCDKGHRFHLLALSDFSALTYMPLFTTIVLYFYLRSYNYDSILLLLYSISVTLFLSSTL